MSLQSAKRIADLQEEFTVLEKQLSGVYDTFRRDIRKQICQESGAYLQSNGFSVAYPDSGVKARYKNLEIELKFEKGEYIGIWDTLDVIGAGEKIPVNILAKMRGVEKFDFIPQGDKETVLKARVEAYKHVLQNISLDSFSFEIRAKNKPIVKASSAAEMLDLVLAD